VRVRPTLLAINGGKPTIDAALRELRQFGESPPRVEVIAGGRLDSLLRLVDRAA
jgi:hypothetical protein